MEENSALHCTQLGKQIVEARLMLIGADVMMSKTMLFLLTAGTRGDLIQDEVHLITDRT